MSDRIPVTVAHRWTICATCGDHRYCHARKVGGLRPVPVCNRCTRTYRRERRAATWPQLPVLFPLYRDQSVKP